MTIELRTPNVTEIGETLAALRSWQHDSAPFQLHPGDLGWFWRLGGEATAAAVRTWTHDGELVAIGLLDGDDLLRLTTAPGASRDRELANVLAHDLNTPARGVLPEGEVTLETPSGALVQELLTENGWQVGEAWTPLARSLDDPVESAGVRIEVVGPELDTPDLVSVRTALQRASFERSTFSDERWNTMAGGPAYTDARCLVAFDENDVAVAAITVWSAGAGRPGLIEPMGVHPDHYGAGYGRAITTAGAASLRELGASSAIVATSSSNVAGINTYKSAGFAELPERRDYRRPGNS
jgi:ribosomal protein S18 acetylase RimI-like enzyme